MQKKEFKAAAFELMSDHDPHQFNQAMMEFGALQCKPQNPDCTRCPLSNSCVAFERNLITVLPQKENKITIRKRYFNYLFVKKGNDIHVRKRTENDIWKNMYDFPLIETKHNVAPQKILQHEYLKKIFGEKKIRVLSSSSLVRHQLTHQTIYARFFVIDTPVAVNHPGIECMSRRRLQRLAVPKLIENFLEATDKK